MLFFRCLVVSLITKAPNQSQRGNSKDQWLCGSAERAIGCQVFFCLFVLVAFSKTLNIFFVYDFRS